MQALQIYAGPAARAQIAREGLAPGHIRIVPGAAGGPKGLILGPLDRFLFGEWLPRSGQDIHLVGASIGAWRLATGALAEPVPAFERFEREYLAENYDPPPGRRRPSAESVSERFAGSLAGFFDGRMHEVLAHPRYRLHVVTARGRHILGREHRVATPLGYLGAFATNLVGRRALGAWLERVVFSSHGAALPFARQDFRTRQVALTEANFQDALRASCSIPFLLRAVPHIAGAPRGAYWDGGITDYHLHMAWEAEAAGHPDGLVLYPHFQRAVVPGWLDKGLRWRHAATPALDRTVVLAPDPAWIATLPGGKLPDRSDFSRYLGRSAERSRLWAQAVGEAGRLADEFAAWLERPDPARIQPL